MPCTSLLSPCTAKRRIADMLCRQGAIVLPGPGRMNTDLSRSVYSAVSTTLLPISCFQCGSDTSAHLAVAPLNSAAIAAWLEPIASARGMG